MEDVKMEKMLEFFIKEFGEDHWCVKDLKKAMKRINEENSMAEKTKSSLGFII